MALHLSRVRVSEAGDCQACEENAESHVFRVRTGNWTMRLCARHILLLRWAIEYTFPPDAPAEMEVEKEREESL